MIVPIIRNRLRIAVEVTCDGNERRGKIVSVKTKAGDVVTEPLEAELVTDVCLEAIEEAAEANKEAL